MGKSNSFQRRAITALVFIVALTGTRVQAAEAGAVTVPKSLSGVLVPAPVAPTVRTAHATITAYASVPGETDSSPFITADGSHVADGIVAANWLPFGTRIRIPQLSGDKVYVVHDRMNKRFPDRVDIWVDSVAKEKAIGLRRNYLIEIL